MRSGIAGIGVLLVLASAVCGDPLPTFKSLAVPLDLSGAVPTAGFDSDKFIVACWLPAYEDLDKWAGRGINVAWSNQWTNPRERPLQDYAAKANSLGISTWRYPGKYMETPQDDAFDAQDKSLSAYSLIDEPMLHNLDPAAIFTQAGQFRQCNPSMRLVLNVEGDKFVMPNPPADIVDRHTRYMEACDIGFVDWYVKNRNADRYPLSHLWTSVERLAVWGKGKPVGAFIECSNQCITAEGREPTPAEMRGEIIGSIIYGARLIAYFPEVPGRTINAGNMVGTGNDGTPPQLEAEMVRINAQLQQLAPILLAPGARVTTLDAPMIGAVRSYNGTRYLIVLNSDTTQQATFNDDTFDPCEWRIYTLDPDGQPLPAPPVPDPAPQDPTPADPPPADPAPQDPPPAPDQPAPDQPTAPPDQPAPPPDQTSPPIDSPPAPDQPVIPDPPPPPPPEKPGPKQGAWGDWGRGGSDVRSHERDRRPRKPDLNPIYRPAHGRTHRFRTEISP